MFVVLTHWPMNEGGKRSADVRRCYCSLRGSNRWHPPSFGLFVLLRSLAGCIMPAHTSWRTRLLYSDLQLERLPHPKYIELCSTQSLDALELLCQALIITEMS